jgi:hypothetical protein
MALTASTKSSSWNWIGSIRDSMPWTWAISSFAWSRRYS